MYFDSMTMDLDWTGRRMETCSTWWFRVDQDVAQRHISNWYWSHRSTWLFRINNIRIDQQRMLRVDAEEGWSMDTKKGIVDGCERAVFVSIEFISIKQIQEGNGLMDTDWWLHIDTYVSIGWIWQSMLKTRYEFDYNLRKIVYIDTFRIDQSGDGHED